MAGNKPTGLENARYVKNVKFCAHQLCVIGVDTDDGPEHPDYDSRVTLPLDEAMVQSMLVRGVDKVLDISIVDGQPVVIDGRRRTLHAREAWNRLTPKQREGHPLNDIVCQVKRLTDVERARWAIVANAFRQNDDVVTEAEKAVRLSGMDVSDDQICQDFGWGIGTLRNRRKLVDGVLPKSVLNMVRSGKLLVSAAMKLHGQIKSGDMTPAEAQEAAGEAAEGGTSKQASRTKTPKDDAGPVRPSIRLMRKILENEEAASAETRHLSDDARRVLKWVLGDGEASAVKGLSAAIRDTAPAPKEDPKKKKAPPRP